MSDSWGVKFSFIPKTSLQVQDIWKDGEFSKWLLSLLDQKSFQELVFKAFENRKRSGCVDRQQVRSIDRNLFFFKLKLLIFRRWRQLWMKSTTIKQRYQMNLFFVVFRSFFSPWYSPLKITLKQLFASCAMNNGEYTPQLRLGEYSPMIMSTSSLANNCWILLVYFFDIKHPCYD